MLVETVYELAEVLGDSLVLHRDVYGRGPAPRRAAVEALLRAGIDPSGLQVQRIPRAVRRRTAVALSTLREAP